MAINPNTQYPGKVAAPDADYPYGGAQNITVPGDGTGTPWEAALLNDIFGMQQALLKSSGIVPSSTPDKVAASQYLQSLVELMSGRGNTYTASGVGNAVTLTAQSNQEPIKSLFTGLTVNFVPIANSTGTVTVDVALLGFKVIKNINNSQLSSGALTTGFGAEIIYNGIDFILQNPHTGRLDSGTFTPTFEGSTVAGTGWTYNGQIGSWVRTGKLLHITYSCRTDTAIPVDAAGQLVMTGLPFSNDYSLGSGSVLQPSASLGLTIGLTPTTPSDGMFVGHVETGTPGVLLFRKVYGSSFKDIIVTTDLTPTVQVAGSITIPLR